MKPFILICCIIYLLNSCESAYEPTRKHDFHSIDFTNNDVFSTCFSIRYSDSDTAYIQQHFASSFLGNQKSGISYYALVTREDRQALDSFLNIIPFHSIDSSYYEGYEDGIDYQICVKKDTVDKCIRVHSHNAPLTLKEFQNWIVERKKGYELHQVDTLIQFESAKYVLSPPEPPRPINFKPPTPEHKR